MSKKYFFVKVKNDDGHPYDWSYGIPGGSHSYTDYWRLVTLSKCPTIELADCDLEDWGATYICAPWNGYTAAHFNRPRKCRVIHWDVERPGIYTQPGVDEVWVSDRTQLMMHQGPKVKYVVLGGHPGLGGDPQEPKRYDLATLAYHDARRGPKFGALHDNGFALSGNAYGAERDDILARSHAGLMLFQDAWAIMTPLRAVLYACWKLPIIAEHVGDSFPYTFIPFDDRLAHFRAYRKPEIQNAIENNYYIATTLFQFRKTVEDAL